MSEFKRICSELKCGFKNMLERLEAKGDVFGDYAFADLGFKASEFAFEAVNRKRYERVSKMNLALDDRKVKHVLDLQEGMKKTILQARDDCMRLANDFEEKVKSGCKTYNSWEIAEIDWGFYLPEDYIRKEWGDDDPCFSDCISRHAMLYMPNIYIREDMPDSRTAENISGRFDYDVCGKSYDGKIWNANKSYPFNHYHEFEDHFISLFMHRIFGQSDCLALYDALNLDADCLWYQIHVNMEKER